MGSIEVKCQYCNTYNTVCVDRLDRSTEKVVEYSQQLNKSPRETQ